MSSASIEELIWRAVEDERKRGAAGLSFAPVYSFTAAVAHMARGQERQTILDALTQTRPEREECGVQCGLRRGDLGSDPHLGRAVKYALMANDSG